MPVTSSQIELSDTSSIRFSSNSNTDAVVVGNTLAQGPMLSVSVNCSSSQNRPFHSTLCKLKIKRFSLMFDGDTIIF